MADYNSSLPVRTEAAGDVIVKVGDGTTPAQQLAVDSSGRVIAKIQDSAGNNLNSTSNALHVNVQNASIAVTATNLDIRDLTHVSDSVKIGDGTDFLAVAADGSIAVTFGNDPAGDEINNYDTTSAVAGGASDNHDYTVTALKTFYVKRVDASGSGKMKIEIQTETGVATGVFNTKFVQFNSTANPNMTIEMPSPLVVAAGVRVRVIRTNRDNQAQDVYSTISGQEV